MSAVPDQIHILSLGAGVQSSALALMAAHGEVKPMPDCAIFGDTQHEFKAVYPWLEYLTGLLPFPIIQRSKGDLAANVLRVRVSQKPGPTFGMTYMKPQIPAYTLYPDGRKGMMGRHCTVDYKIEVVRRECRKRYGKQQVTVWIGISTDEADRMKESPNPQFIHRYPLIEKGISRQGCLDWMAAYGYKRPPKSACEFCPYHSDATWAGMAPDEFARAVEFERQLQVTAAQIPRLFSVPYLHNSRVPLDQVKFNADNQQDLFGNECQGMCGV
jgi:hypothetical protein